MRKALLFVVCLGFLGCPKAKQEKVQDVLNKAKADLEKVQAIAVGPCGKDAAAALLAIGKAGASCSTEIQAVK